MPAEEDYKRVITRLESFLNASHNYMHATGLVFLSFLDLSPSERAAVEDKVRASALDLLHAGESWAVEKLLEAVSGTSSPSPDAE